MKNTVHIRPLSVNRAWRGRRFKTPEYSAYEQHLALLLPKLSVPKGKLAITLLFGFSSKASDIDNGIKPFIDILQKKYSFNDKMIYKLDVQKCDVKKGSEFVQFEIRPLST